MTTAGPLERGRGAAVHLAQQVEARPDAGQRVARDVRAFRALRADGQEDGGVGREIRRARRGADAHAVHERDPDLREQRDFGVEDRARQAVGRNAVAQHPAGLGPLVEHRHRVAAAREVVGAREARRARADDADARRARRGGRFGRQAPVARFVRDRALDGVDRDGAVERIAVAVRLARVIADAPADGGKRIVLADRAPRAGDVALGRQREERAHVGAGRAVEVAGRGARHVLGAERAPVAGRELARAAERHGHRRAGWTDSERSDAHHHRAPAAAAGRATASNASRAAAWFASALSGTTSGMTASTSSSVTRPVIAANAPTIAVFTIGLVRPAEAVCERDGRGVAGGDPEGRRQLQLFRVTARVHENPAARVQAGRDVDRREQHRVEDDDVIGLVDVAVNRDGLVIGAKEGGDRRAGALRPERGERLDEPAFTKERRSEEFGRDDRALSSAAVKADSDHPVPPWRSPMVSVPGIRRVPTLRPPANRRRSGNWAILEGLAERNVPSRQCAP